MTDLEQPEVKVATFVPAIGKQMYAEPTDGKDFTLAEMQSLVGGDLELVVLPDGREL